MPRARSARLDGGMNGQLTPIDDNPDRLIFALLLSVSALISALVPMLDSHF